MITLIGKLQVKFGGCAARIGYGEDCRAHGRAGDARRLSPFAWIMVEIMLRAEFGSAGRGRGKAALLTAVPDKDVIKGKIGDERLSGGWRNPRVSRRLRHLPGGAVRMGMAK